MKKLSYILTLMLLPSFAFAQIGVHRNDFSIGVNGGYNMSSVMFTPKVSQSQLGGINAGLSARYVCEKYFNTICSVYGEINYSQMGWKEDILDIDNQPVIITETKQPMAYSRTINYIQVPVFAHLAWGREERGLNIFVNAGPQFGLYLNDSQTTNFDVKNMPKTDNDRVSPVVAQDTMAIKNKLDYGIALGLGAEYSIPKVGHFLAEARYYYGLGNIYGASKRDYFGKSNYGQIVLKLSYLFDITRTKNVRRK